MPQLTLSLSPDLQGNIDARVTAEGLAGSAEFLRALLERDREAHRKDVARVQTLIDDGIASGVCEQDAFDVLDEIIADLRRQHG